MSCSPLPFDVTTPTLAVAPWHDPVLEAVGHDPRSGYVERFWLPILGPSTLLLVRRITSELDRQPDGFDLDLEDAARGLGLSLRGGPSGPFFRALGRTAQFHITKATGPTTLMARSRIQTLSHRQLERLPDSLRAEHGRWIADHDAEPDEHERRARARRMALSLLELGESAETAELQLHRWKVHPAVAHDALRWARERLTSQTQLTAADRTGPGGDAA